MNTERGALKTTSLQILFILLVVCCGCYFILSTSRFADVDTAQKRDSKFIESFDRQHYYYQTFTSSAYYLSAIEFSLLSLGYADNDNFHVFVQLRDHNQNEIASKKYAVPKSAQIYDLRFNFRPQQDSLHKEYSLLLQTNAPPDTVLLLGSEYDAYAGGELFTEDGVSNKQDISFFTYTRPPPSLLIIQTIRYSAGRFTIIFLISIFTFCLGYIITSYFLLYRNLLELIIYTLIFGICISPTLFFILSLLKIEIEKGLLITILLSLLLVMIVIKLNDAKKNGQKAIMDSLQIKEIFILGLLFVLAIFTRVSQIKNLIVPSSVGAQFHQKVLEGIALNKEIPLDSIYHLGFHSNVFLVHTLTNSSIPEATLLFGQWLSIASGLSFYLLARKVFGYPIYALIATSLYWFISPIPAYFINIGRYPFLQGMTLLPAAIAFLLDDENFRAQNKIPFTVLLIGVFLSHYGTIIIFTVVALGVTLHKLFNQELHRLTLNTYKSAILKFGVVFLPLILVAIIKAFYIIEQGSWESFLRSPTITITLEDYKYTFNHTLKHGGILLWLLGVSGGLIFFTRHLRLFIIMVICGLILFGLSQLQIALLGHSASRMTNTLFSLSIPLSILGGYTLVHFSKITNSLGYVLLITISLVGAYNISGIVNPRNVFYTAADQEAMNWIRNNTALSNVIMINSYPWDERFGPTDGGAWITYLTGRKIVFLNTRAEFDEIENFISQSKVDYVYIGPGYGDLTPISINMADKILLYNRNGIYIYGK